MLLKKEFSLAGSAHLVADNITMRGFFLLLFVGCWICLFVCLFCLFSVTCLQKKSNILEFFRLAQNPSQENKVSLNQSECFQLTCFVFRVLVLQQMRQQGHKFSFIINKSWFCKGISNL